MRMRLLWLMVIGGGLAGLLGVAGPVLAQGGGVPAGGAAIPDLATVLRLLAEGGAVGVILSWLLENVPAFQRLSADQKRWGTLGLSLLLPLLAEVLLQYVQAATWAALTPFWLALARGFVSWAGTQLNYYGVIKPQQRAMQTAVIPRLELAWSDDDLAEGEDGGA